MNTAQLSEEAKQVLKSHVGYRSEDTSEFSDGHVRIKSIDILDTEINDLQNTDISDTLHDLYGTPANWQPEQIDEFIKETLKLDEYYLIWVTATPEDAECYADDPENVDEIKIDCKKLMLISDLACDGVLLATDYSWIR